MRTHRNCNTEIPRQKKKYQLNHDRAGLRQPGMGDQSPTVPVTLKLSLAWYRDSV